MNGKELLEWFEKSDFMIPTQESIIKFADEQWLEIFKEWRWFAYSQKIGLVLDLDINNLRTIKEYLLDDWKWNLYKIDDESIWIKKSFDLIIDPVIGGLLIVDKVNDFKSKITHNSVYDEVIAIINGIWIDMTDYNRI